MSETFWDRHGLHGVMAEFETPEDLLDAAERAYAAGYRKMEGYSPLPVEGLAEAIGFTRHWVAPTVLVGGVLGCCGGFGLLWWITKIAYAHNVAGRPFNSWPRLHSRDVRVYRVAGSSNGGIRHARNEWPAAALSSRVQ